MSIPIRVGRKVPLIIGGVAALLLAIFVANSSVGANDRPCTASSNSLRAARSAYASSCSAPRIDCDPVANRWVCSSEQIGSQSPASKNSRSAAPAKSTSGLDGSALPQSNPAPQPSGTERIASPRAVVRETPTSQPIRPVPAPIRKQAPTPQPTQVSPTQAQAPTPQSAQVSPTQAQAPTPQPAQVSPTQAQAPVASATQQASATPAAAVAPTPSAPVGATPVAPEPAIETTASTTPPTTNPAPVKLPPIKPSTGSWKVINDSQFKTFGNNPDPAQYSADWSGKNGFVADGGATDGYRVAINKGESNGANRMFSDFPNGTKEAVIRYRMFVPSDYASLWKEQDYNMKLPGLAGPISSANGGFGGSQLSNRPNSDRAWSIRQLLHRPHSKYKSLAMGMEHYWQGSSHLSKGNYYGDPQWYKSDGQSINESLAAVPGKWVEVKVHVKVNDHNVANGFLRTYLDGKPGYTKENFEWSKAADMLTINHLWFCVYHGGLAKKSDGQIVLFFRQFEYQILG